MKKLKLLFASLAIFSAVIFSSCSKSNEELISDYKSLCEKVENALKDGDMDKVSSLAKEGQELGEELDKRDLSDAEKEQVAEITSKLAKAISGTMDSAGRNFSMEVEEVEE